MGIKREIRKAIQTLIEQSQLSGYCSNINNDVIENKISDFVYGLECVEKNHNLNRLDATLFEV